MDYLLILIGAVLLNHFMTWHSAAPEKRLEEAVYAGIAVLVVTALASLISHAAYQYLLIPAALEYLYPILFLLVTGSLMAMGTISLRKLHRGMYEAIVPSLPMILISCGALALYMAEANKSASLPQAVGSAAGSAFGLALAGVLFDVIRERLLISTLPNWMKGFAGALITVGLMAVAFLGFRGLIG